ncbi:hypothetical protein PHISP_01294 [Aspergillus sp. HF37]|nr:hypothetical protein PHISP_01294 [Aspergillus sp. HF37]
MELNNPPGRVRSHRSYPALNHVSLAPLTPRFPIDDDPDPQEDASAHDDTSDGALPSQSRTSYLASRSVPGTPGVLSGSRSTSRTRRPHPHPRSKSSSRAPGSDTDLPQLEDSSTPQHHSAKRKSARPDSEWMLRTGIALASSTREEKGQSWLEKRESSTSLASLGYDSFPQQQQRPHSSHNHHYHHRSLSGRKPRSGTSTPRTPSRRGSRSLAASRRNSKAGLALTSLDMAQSERPSRSGVASPGLGEEERDFVPAIVDERIRSEIAEIQHDLEDDMSSLETSSVESESDDGGIDELEMQRLTRERGFGLGGWIDRLVEWTLFGVEDLPSTAPAAAQPAPSSGNGLQTTSGLGDQIPVDDEKVPEGDSDNDLNMDVDDDYDTSIARDYDVPAPVEKPGDRGGWQDVQWLLRVIKHALL